MILPSGVFSSGDVVGHSVFLVKLVVGAFFNLAVLAMALHNGTPPDFATGTGAVVVDTSFFIGLDLVAFNLGLPGDDLLETVWFIFASFGGLLFVLSFGFGLGVELFFVLLTGLLLMVLEVLEGEELSILFATVFADLVDLGVCFLTTFLLFVDLVGRFGEVDLVLLVLVVMLLVLGLSPQNGLLLDSPCSCSRCCC